MPKSRSKSRRTRSSPRSRTKGFRPDGPLTDAALERGRRAFNLWYLYGPKAGDSLVLSSDAQVMNAWWMEIDPSITSYELKANDEAHKPDAHSPSAEFDAKVALADGTTQLRAISSHDLPLRGADAEKSRQEQEVQGQIAALVGASYLRVGPAQLKAHDILIGNAKIALATLGAARSHSIELQHANLLALLKRHSAWTVEGLLQHVEAQDQALFLAAVFRAISRGPLRSDVHEHPWGKRTRVWVGEDDDAPPPSSGATSTNASAAEQAPVGIHLLGIDSTSASRALRTADASAAMACALERAESAPQAGKYTRKNIPPEYRDPAQWPAADLQTLGQAQLVERARRLRAALCGYLEGAPVRMLEQAHHISRSEILRLLNRALSPAPDGAIVGWRALLYGYHVGYKRILPVEPGSASGGFAGALEQLFASHPDIRDSLVSLVLLKGGSAPKESHVTAKRVHGAFLKLCAARGIPTDHYPFNNASRGLRSIARFVKAIRASHFVRSAGLLGGKGAAHRAKLYCGLDVLLRHPQPFDAVQQDAHTLDVIGSIRIPHPKGERRIPIKRLALQVIIEVETKAILGYSVCLLGRISAQDALAAVQHALAAWKPLQVEQPLISYPDGAGFPSGVIPGLAGAAWATHYLDNDAAYTSALFAERIRNRVGCAVNWGPVADWTRRYVVEGVFSVLEKVGFQRLPSTTGSGPKDPKRKNPASQAVTHEIDYTELIYLIDVALATYNATPLQSLGYRSPLQLLRERTQGPKSNFLARYLPPLAHSMADMHIVTETRPVRGNLAQGRRPYVEIDGVLHTNQLLAQCAVLIGQKIIVHIDNDDMRHVMAFLPDGQPLGALVAQSGWNRVPHSRQMRKLINRLRNNHELTRRPDEDWVEAFLANKTHQAATTAAAAARANTVSKVATQVADIAHRTGQDVPCVPDPLEPPAIAEPALHRTILPAFLQRPVRRAIL